LSGLSFRIHVYEFAGDNSTVHSDDTNSLSSRNKKIELYGWTNNSNHEQYSVMKTKVWIELMAIINNITVSRNKSLKNKISHSYSYPWQDFCKTFNKHDFSCISLELFLYCLLDNIRYVFK